MLREILQEINLSRVHRWVGRKTKPQLLPKIISGRRREKEGWKETMLTLTILT